MLPRFLHPAWLLFFCAAPLPGIANQPASSTGSVPSAIADTDTDLGPSLDDALERGDIPRLEKIARAHQQPRSGPERARLNTSLARAWILLGDNARALHFARTAYQDSADPAPRWLAAELLYSRGEWNLGKNLEAELRQRDETSPILPYLEARYQLARLADVDANFTQPLMVDARRDALAAVAAANSSKAQAHGDFDPRFLSAGIDVALFDLNYPLAAAYAVQLSGLRPRNPSLARLALALSFDTPELRDALLASLRTQESLPKEELAHWESQAWVLDSAPENERATVWLAVADTARADPQLAGLDIHFIGRAAASMPARDNRAPALADAYADAALAGRSAPHARAAFKLLSPESATTPALRERRIALAKLANHYDLAAKLALDEAGLHAKDFDWLARNRSTIARSQTFGVYISYLLTMERLRPDDPVVQLELARVHRQHASTEAYDYYTKAFAQAPEKIRPSMKDWLDYRQLVKAAEQRRQPKNAQAQFDRTIERIQKSATDDAPAAHFYAELLHQRANRSQKPGDRAAADEALRKAVALDPAIGDVFSQLNITERPPGRSFGG